ncbi:hypothetical protein BJ165DRAFT_1396841 [Panaeolus papilionaceus]|nr:hypothetical protein BJ165DRAFT_1396841 [Panaeolus papilionaceus]
MESYTESPISRLPYDVLLDILFLVRDLHAGQEKAKFCQDATTVSALWRRELYATPLWWNDLQITYPCSLSVVQRHLELGETCPLRLEIRLDPELQNETQNIIALVNSIVPHLYRCWRFSFDGETSDESAFYLTENIISKHEMPLLRHFTFNLLGGADKDTNFNSVLPKWSSLTDLRLGGVNIEYLHNPLPQLTHLHLSRGQDRERISFVHFGDILLSCPNLTLLALYDDILAHYSDVSNKHVTHSNIQSILILGNMLHASEFLVYVDAPNLRELVIAPVVAGDFRRLANLDVDKCQNKFRALKKLTLAPAYRQAVIRCHKASVFFPGVETLVFANVYPMQFKKMFMLIPDAYPNLLHLGVTGVDKGFIPIILTVVEMRRKRDVVARLKTVFVDSESYDQVREAVVEHQQRFDDLGLEVVRGDLWEDQRREAMFSDKKMLFIGRYEPDGDSDVPDDQVEL